MLKTKQRLYGAKSPTPPPALPAPRIPEKSGNSGEIGTERAGIARGPHGALTSPLRARGIPKDPQDPRGSRRESHRAQGIPQDPTGSRRESHRAQGIPQGPGDPTGPRGSLRIHRIPQGPRDPQDPRGSRRESHRAQGTPQGTGDPSGSTGSRRESHRIHRALGIPQGPRDPTGPRGPHRQEGIPEGPGDPSGPRRSKRSRQEFLQTQRIPEGIPQDREDPTGSTGTPQNPTGLSQSRDKMEIRDLGTREVQSPFVLGVLGGRSPTLRREELFWLCICSLRDKIPLLRNSMGAAEQERLGEISVKNSRRNPSAFLITVRSLSNSPSFVN
ncbi:basic salivary proline-rich protein 1-like [Poecile atricapillus]|uniref:basic salivary proline-rich protein 1-like n=1 Tax=Poecile atricapillus TaxID=48891 RepID=UPI002739A8B3|nr:basic salivary proline-rich protein 1-like [Poecile atricapillus]